MINDNDIMETLHQPVRLMVGDKVLAQGFITEANWMEGAEFEFGNAKIQIVLDTPVHVMEMASYSGGRRISYPCVDRMQNTMNLYFTQEKLREVLGPKPLQLPQDPYYR